MDYFGILKKAWNITWKYKMLWVLGLFAGVSSSGSSGGSGGNSSYQQSSGDYSSASMDRFTQWIGDNVLLIAILVGALVVISIVFWVLSIAAQGGLVHGANEAAEGRTPSLKASWGVGFGRWGRTFMIGFVIGLPIFAIAMVMVLLFVVLGVGGAAGGEEAIGAAVFGGLCFVLPVFIILIAVASVIVGVVYPLALRYGVLEDTTFGQAIKRGWADLWAKKGAFVFWLVMLLPQVAYGLITLAIMVPFLIPAVLMVVKEQYVMAGGFVVLMMLVMLVPGAIYGTFVSSAWTCFFREMTGLEPKAVTTPMPYPRYAPPMPPTVEPVPAPVAEQPIVDVEPVVSASATEWSAPPAEAPSVDAEAPIVDVEAPGPSAGFEPPAAVTEVPPAEETPPADA